MLLCWLHTYSIATALRGKRNVWSWKLKFAICFFLERNDWSWRIEFAVDSSVVTGIIVLNNYCQPGQWPDYGPPVGGPPRCRPSLSSIRILSSSNFGRRPGLSLQNPVVIEFRSASKLIKLEIQSSSNVACLEVQRWQGLSSIDIQLPSIFASSPGRGQLSSNVASGRGRVYHPSKFNNHRISSSRVYHPLKSSHIIHRT